jgi:hypothetical protein
VRWGTARWAGPVRVQRTERFCVRTVLLKCGGVLAWGKVPQKVSVRWTRTGPAQRAVPHQDADFWLGSRNSPFVGKKWLAKAMGAE